MSINIEILNKHGYNFFIKQRKKFIQKKIQGESRHHVRRTPEMVKKMKKRIKNSVPKISEYKNTLNFYEMYIVWKKVCISYCNFNINVFATRNYINYKRFKNTENIRVEIYYDMYDYLLNEENFQLIFLTKHFIDKDIYDENIKRLNLIENVTE